MLAFESEDRPKSLNLISRIQTAQDHLNQLYDEVRNFAAPLKLQLETWNLAHIWRQAWGNLHLLRQGKKATLFVETKYGLDLRCSVDQFWLGQVFRDILENALAACQEPVEIRVLCSHSEIDGQPAIRIAFRDNGPGLNAEQRQRIDPFFTTKTKGTGLGMAIAQRIVEAHGGRMAVGSGSGRGAEILVTLPQKKL
jgi:signal transduction histidine kinase